MRPGVIKTSKQDTMSVSRNTVYNLGGSLLSLAVALFTVPLYIHRIGEARYGVLALIWLLLGYFGLFDLGLGRATAQAVAADGRDRESIASIVWTALGINACLGLVGGAVLWVLGSLVLERFVHLSPEMRSEVLAALPWVAAAVPVATLSSIIPNALQGRQLFLGLNILSVIGSLAFQVVPLMVAYSVSVSLGWLIPAAVLARMAGALLLWSWGAKRLQIGLPSFPRVAVARRLFRYGAWITVTNILGPLLDGLDRFVIGAQAGAQAVSYYVVPYGIAIRPAGLAASLAGALFPRFADADEKERERLNAEGIATLAVIATPAICAGIALMGPFLSVWIGLDFAKHATLVGEVLLVGVWINLLSYIPFTRLQAAGRPDLPAIFHAVELPLYLAALWFVVGVSGAYGAAAVWSTRVAVDGGLLFWASRAPRRVWVHCSPGGLLVILMALITWLAPQTTLVSTEARAAIVVAALVWAAYAAPSALRSFLSNFFGIRYRRRIPGR